MSAAPRGVKEKAPWGNLRSAETHPADGTEPAPGFALAKLGMCVGAPLPWRRESP